VVEYLPGTLEGLGSIGTSERERQKNRGWGGGERKRERERKKRKINKIKAKEIGALPLDRFSLKAPPWMTTSVLITVICQDCDLKTERVTGQY
jgi:hypothetical protein